MKQEQPPLSFIQPVNSWAQQLYQETWEISEIPPKNNDPLTLAKVSYYLTAARAIQDAAEASLGEMPPIVKIGYSVRNVARKIVPYSNVFLPPTEREESVRSRVHAIERATSPVDLALRDIEVNQQEEIVNPDISAIVEKLAPDLKETYETAMSRYDGQRGKGEKFNIQRKAIGALVFDLTEDQQRNLFTLQGYNADNAMAVMRNINRAKDITIPIAAITNVLVIYGAADGFLNNDLGTITDRAAQIAILQSYLKYGGTALINTIAQVISLRKIGSATDLPATATYHYLNNRVSPLARDILVAIASNAIKGFEEISAWGVLNVNPQSSVNANEIAATKEVLEALLNIGWVIKSYVNEYMLSQQSLKNDSKAFM